MRPCEKNIARKRGDTMRVTFTVKHKGKPVDISGWTNFKLGIDTRSAPTDNSTNIANLTGSIAVGGLDGRVYFIVPSSIPAGDYYYDAQATDENGEIGTFVEGSWRVKEDRAK
jgi:hypothetical protein